MALCWAKRNGTRADLRRGRAVNGAGRTDCELPAVVEISGEPLCTDHARAARKALKRDLGYVPKSLVSEVTGEACVRFARKMGRAS